MNRVLFICSQNRLRSPTAELVFAKDYGVETASAGLNAGADNPVTAELIEWADTIVVMEKAHREKLQRTFRGSLKSQRVVCLDIPDDFEYMQPALVEILKQKSSRFL